MVAVWEMTSEDLLLCVTPREIAKRLSKSEGHIREIINNLQKEKLPYDTFYEEGFHGNTRPTGNTRRRYRLHEDTVILPETAWILIDLAQQGENHRISLEAINKTVKRAEITLEVNPDDTYGRIQEAIRTGYLKANIRNSLTIRDRLLREREYLKILAQKLDQPQSLTSQKAKNKIEEEV